MVDAMVGTTVDTMVQWSIQWLMQWFAMVDALVGTMIDTMVGTLVGAMVGTYKCNHMQESPRHKRPSRRVQLTLHATRPSPHGASRLVQQAMSVWSVKTRRTPSRRCRDARIYGHATTAMHDMRAPPSTPQ